MCPHLSLGFAVGAQLSAHDYVRHHHHRGDVYRARKKPAEVAGMQQAGNMAHHLFISPDIS